MKLLLEDTIIKVNNIHFEAILQKTTISENNPEMSHLTKPNKYKPWGFFICETDPCKIFKINAFLS